MDVLKSRSRFHAEHTGALIVLLFALTATIKLAINPYDKQGQDIAGVFGFFVLFLWLMFGFLVRLILKIPGITISDEGIFFKTVFSKRNIGWSEIETINLAGKRSRSFNDPEEVSTLELKNGEKIFIRIECYKNSPEIRQLLERINTSIGENKSISVSFRDDPFYFRQPYKIRHDIPAGETFTKYAGTPYLNFNAILFYGFSIALIISSLSVFRSHPERILIPLIPIIAFYLAFGFFLHYFLVSDKFIVIKNAFWFWKRHVYAIDEVREVVFEEIKTRKTSSNAMRIITKDFKTKSYPAAGLWSKNWKQLKKYFQSVGITVRDHISL